MFIDDGDGSISSIVKFVDNVGDGLPLQPYNRTVGGSRMLLNAISDGVRLNTHTRILIDLSAFPVLSESP
jgi:hypothetical protein